jgi:hypothetical protein
MRRITLFIFFLLFHHTVFSQYVANYYASLESNRPKGNKYLFYRLYSTSTSSFPASASDFETSFATSANYKTSGYVALATNAGNLNTSLSNTSNILNYVNSTQLGTAIGTQTPYTGFNGDGFTIVISGYFIPKQTGTYTFSIEGDDSVDLFINNQNIVNQYGPNGTSAIGTHTGTIALTAGKKYLFRARMQEGGGGEGLQMFWKKPSEASGSVWYQDVEELTGEEVLQNGLVLSLDPGNWYTYPKYGSTIYDLKGNANGTIYNNTTYSTSNGGTFYLDGDQDYIDFGKTPANFPTGDISVFVWLKASAFRNGWNIFFTKWFTDTSGNGGYNDMHYDIYPSGSNYYQNLYTTNTSNIFGSTPLSTNTWYYLGFTISTSGNFQMYVNGALDGTARTGITRTNYTQSNLWLGDPRTGGTVDFNGYLGSVHVYNKVLSADEVFQNFNATKHKYGL